MEKRLAKDKSDQESQVKKNRLSKTKEKWSFVKNDNIGGKTPASGNERKTWNSRCGTDIGVFEQVTNDMGKRARNSTDDNANAKRKTRKNFEINVQTVSNTNNNIEQESVKVSIQQDSSDYDQEEEIHIIKEIAAKTPATIMNIKQENADYDQGEEIQITKKIAARKPATILSIKQENQNYRPKVVITSLISPTTDKSSTGAPALPSSSQLLPESQTHNETRHSFHFTRSGLTIIPVGPSPANSFSTSSEAGEITRHINYGATKPRGSSLSQNGTARVGPAATNSFLASSEAATGRILDGRAQDAARASPSKSPVNNGSGDMMDMINHMTRDTLDKTATQSKTPVNVNRDIHGDLNEATASQGNSPGSNVRRDTIEGVIDEATDQGMRSPGDIEVTIGSADITLKNGEAQMKINDVCMKGPAKCVAIFVKESTCAVHENLLNIC